MNLLNKTLVQLALSLPTGTEYSSIDEVSNAIMSIFYSIQTFALVVAVLFAAFELIKFFVASGQEKMQHLKMIGYTLMGVVILVLLPSIVQFILGFF